MLDLVNFIQQIRTLKKLCTNLKKHISAKLFSATDEVMEGGAPMSPSIARITTTKRLCLLERIRMGKNYLLVPISTKYNLVQE